MMFPDYLRGTVLHGEAGCNWRAATIASQSHPENTKLGLWNRRLKGLVLVNRPGAAEETAPRSSLAFISRTELIVM